MNKKSLLLALSALLFVNSSVGMVEGKSKSSAPKAKTNDKAMRAKLCASPQFKEGVKLFQSKNYAGALKTFFKLDSTGFCCDLVHYYIGQCYQKTNQTVAAQMHYDWVLTRSKDPQLRAYAEYANQVISYYSGHRTYEGQGNNFDRGGGGAAVTRRSANSGFG